MQSKEIKTFILKSADDKLTKILQRVSNFKLPNLLKITHKWCANMRSGKGSKSLSTAAIPLKTKQKKIKCFYQYPFVVQQIIVRYYKKKVCFIINIINNPIYIFYINQIKLFKLQKGLRQKKNVVILFYKINMKNQKQKECFFLLLNYPL